MGNSCKEILGIVSYVTADVDQDGVEKALKYYNMI
jgi:hydroxymethylpyrimidine pyrophosphatase-like HAD family hydrolase